MWTVRPCVQLQRLLKPLELNGRATWDKIRFSVAAQKKVLLSVDAQLGRSHTFTHEDLDRGLLQTEGDLDRGLLPQVPPD